MFGLIGFYAFWKYEEESKKTIFQNEKVIPTDMPLRKK